MKLTDRLALVVASASLWSCWACWACALLLSPAALAGTGTGVEQRPPCQVMFDAGSSGTRLSVFVRKGRTWEEHVGPKVSALADPVREIRGRHYADMAAVNAEVVATLDEMRHAGPPNAKGQPAWQAFDWTTQCRVESARIYATAGMRLAEREQRERSAALWADLHQRLQQRLGASVSIETRTLSGFEEGLYAWLAVRQALKGRSDFGIAEMGGASSQITFPCKRCDAADDATRMVKVDGKSLRIYSYSFLGLGQDEAPHTLGVAPTCAYGVGLDHPGWQPADCANTLTLALQEPTQGIVDPYNRDHGPRGSHRRIPTERADHPRWFLTGAFNYMHAGDIDTTCRRRGPHVGQEASACFKPIYLQSYLQALRIPASAPKIESSWTLGAVLCAASQCLRPSQPPM